MSTFTPAETAACRRLVDMGLEEDVGTGDLTCQAVIPEALEGRAIFVARAPGVVSGLPAAAQVFAALDPRVAFEPIVSDGAAVQAGQRLAAVAGPMRSVLTGERLALNFLQHLSGIATLTRRYVDAVAELSVKILDTRKTQPGWRSLEKYAVRCGGGHNHRMGLYDGILIKDNHLVAMGMKGALELDDLTETFTCLNWERERKGGRLSEFPIEVEVESIAEFKEWLDWKPAIILLDNMNTEQLRKAVVRRDKRQPHVLLEASGGVNLQTVRAIAETGVDRISVGALTHSAPALDIALDYSTD